MKRNTFNVQPLLLILTLVFSGQFLFSQVGIGTVTPDPSSALDVNSTTAGLLIPTMNQAQRDAIAAPATGLLIFQTNNTAGFYYFDGTVWTPLAGGGGGNDWALTGNAIVGTDFLGTTNAQDLRIRTNNLERVIVEDDGQVLMNIAAPYFVEDILTAEGQFAVNGYSDLAAGIGVYGEGTVGGDGTWGVSSTGIGTFGGSINGVGVQGETNTNIAVVGLGSIAGVLGDVIGGGVGVQGQTTTGVGTRGLSTSTGDGVQGITVSGAGVYGEADSGGGYAGDFRNTNAQGHGLIVSGNNELPTVVGASGAGITGTGTTYGTMGFGNDPTNSTGIVGASNDLGTFYTVAVDGSGVAGSGSYFGVGGFSDNNDGTGVLGIGGASTGVGVQGQGNTGVVGLGDTGVGDSGVYGNGKIGVLGEEAVTMGMNNFGVFSIGDFGGTGGKYFVIDHPLDPQNKILKHANIESNEILNLYRGTEVFDSSGKATIQLPDYYDSMNINPSYQMSPIGAAMPGLYIERELQNGQFVIAGGVPGKKVSWQVTAERNDPYLQQYPEKRQMEIDKGEARGKFIRPELYGRSADMSYFPRPKPRDVEKHNLKDVTKRDKSAGENPKLEVGRSLEKNKKGAQFAKSNN